MLMMIHPVTGDVVTLRAGEGNMARNFLAYGYRPIGPNGLAAAARFDAAANVAHDACDHPGISAATRKHMFGLD